jgi:dolichol-phosphate mannosyltransferase
LQTINFNEIKFIGYAFQIEMKFAAWKLGFRIKEIPIIFIDRKAGVSKMSKRILNEGVFGVLVIQLKSLFGNYRKRMSVHQASKKTYSHSILTESD